MRRIVQRLERSFWGIVAVVIVFGIFTVTGIPFAFIFIEIGKFAGPILGWVLTILTLLGIVLCIPLIAYLTATKLGRTRLRWGAIFSFIMSFLVFLSFSLVFLQRVSQQDEKIDLFVAKNASSGFEQHISNISSFLDVNVQKSLSEPEKLFKIDNLIYNVFLGSSVMGLWGATRAGLIFYQGWGTCGQAAIVIEHLLLRGGYEARQGRFKNYDHQWAEVKHNGTWWIVDPWWLTSNGSLVGVQHLRGLRTEFEGLLGVWVTHSNGTRADSSSEHGY